MRRALAAAFALALASAAVVLAAPTNPPLRIAVPGPVAGPCTPAGAAATAAERALYAHLSRRLERPVQRCPVADRAAAAAALAAGRADLAVLDPAAYRPVAGQVRAILTTRPRSGPSRVPVVAVVRRTSRATTLAELRGLGAVYGGGQPTGLALPRRVLADHGAPAGFFAAETVAADPEAAIAMLRAGGADVLLLNASAHQRLCRADRPGQEPCADLKTVFRGRARPATAFAVRRDMPDELRFRLIGVMVALHLEAPAAFAHILAQTPGTGELEPTEADALAVSASR